MEHPGASSTASCFCPHGMGHMGQESGRAGGRPVTGSDLSPQEGVKRLNRQRRPEQSPSRSALLQPLCFKSWGPEGRVGKQHSALRPCHYLQAEAALHLYKAGRTCSHRGQTTAAGRGHRWWISVQTLPDDPLQRHQLPPSQQLSMSWGQHREQPSMEHGSLVRHSSCSLPSQAGRFPWQSQVQPRRVQPC